MLLAQITPDAVNLAAWLGSASFVMLLVNQAMTMHRNLRGTPVNEALGCEANLLKDRIAKIEDRVSGCQEYSKQRRDAIYEEVRKSSLVAAGLVNDLRKDTTGMVADLHEKINDLGRQVAGIERAVEIQDQRLAQIDAKLDRLIERRA
jgi:hypothetical protein